MRDMESEAPRVRLDPWAEGDLGLLRAMNAPELMSHLGGPETEDQLLTRHRRYVDLSADRTGRGRMFRIVLLPAGEAVGTIGFWEQTWQGRQIYETGWGVLAAHQGRGIAAAAAAAVVEKARAESKYRYLHAFPSVGNRSSNALCGRVGFSLRGPCEVEFPKGHLMRANDWRLDLTPGAEGQESPGPAPASDGILTT
ncbi:N-acetyltransferase GCN5 [Streptomyces scopuliridis RB72]|uniref:N-acetyltransferase GCN5 n=2 Tax=Streptomyces scopuliridis TaxID=452529 RepID=A0A2T7SYE7_9ACTN|nr:N-acetyltransferase GCN5 [Streptomyces scopuliridis RB72]